MYNYVLWAALLLLFLSCSNEPRPPSAGRVPPNLWAQYKVWGEEGDSTATCMLQFYSDAQMRQTLLLEPPAGVQIDGQHLVADSAGIVGAFYEYQAAAPRFAGRHTIKFTDLEDQVFEDNFIFQPFTLKGGLPAVLSGDDLELPLSGLANGSAVRIVLIDTTEAGTGINELVRVQNEKIMLPAHYWQDLAPGPIILHLTAEEERPLKSRLQGQILITYGLSRIVELQK
jgi:hypothetical protein